VPPGVPSGIVDVRVTGRFGVSNPRSFLVETVGARVQPATNVTPATAAPLDRGGAAWSRLSAANRSVFRLEARKDERIRVRVQAAELDSRLVPDVTAFDAQGREIARSRRIGFIDFRASTDGACRVEVNDLQYHDWVNASAPNTISTMVLSVISKVPGTGQLKNLVPTTSAKPKNMEMIMPSAPMSSSTSANLRTHSLIFCMLCCPEKWGDQPRPLAGGG
jgi:hypothetical protein